MPYCSVSLLNGDNADIRTDAMCAAAGEAGVTHTMITTDVVYTVSV